MKKITRCIAAFACVALLFSMALFSASAKQKLDVPNNFRILTGQFGDREESTARDPSKGSYAWLQDVFIRESVNALLYNSLEPIDDYPFSTTYTGFKEEVKYFLEILGSSKEPIAMFNEFMYVFQQVQIGMQTLGIGASEYEQRVWLEDEYGIVFPDQNADLGDYDSQMTTLLYLSLRYEFAHAVFGISEITIPAGVWFEEAAVTILKSYMGERFDMAVLGEDPLMNIVTLNGLVTAVMRVYLETQGIVMDADATDLEIMSAMSVAIAKDAGAADVPDLGGMSEEQLEVYELVAELFLYWGVMCEPGAIMDALQIEDFDQRADAIARIVLETMIKERGSQKIIDKIPEMTDIQLFDQCLILNYFELGQSNFVNSISAMFGSGGNRRNASNNSNGRDFYSDVYQYDVQLNYKRSEMYISAFSYAPLMNPVGFTKNVTLKVNGEKVPVGRAVRIDLEPELQEQYVEFWVNYKDKDKGINQTCVYIFNIFQGIDDPPENEVGLVQSLYSAAQAVSSMLDMPVSNVNTPPSTPEPEPPSHAAYIPPMEVVDEGQLPELFGSDLFAPVVGVFTASPIDTSMIAGMFQQKAAPKPEGFAAVMAYLKADNRWIYFTGGFLALSTAVTVFIIDQKKQEAEHMALGFKSKVGAGGRKKKTKTKVKADNRF
ncbi:MAG: hypothetical protein FWG82_02100 [Oscillospiraceae bacterium]|nr:hypothetical protein [Oscillospiraceae bacterium]